MSQNQAETSQQPQQQQKPPVLEEDDEFEDFPVEGESFFRNHSRAHRVLVMPVFTALLP